MKRVLDRRVSFDERSRNFPIRAIVPKRPRSYTWSVGATWLDQGTEGACVGFAWAHELIARPAIVASVTDAFALERIYHEARKIDEWPGENYDGTSVLAGAKVVKAMGAMAEYRWAFGLDDLRLAIGHAGPAVLGLNWYEGMFDPDEQGFIRPSGSIAGGHAIVCYAVNQKQRYFKLRNSWGRDWGRAGDCFLSFDDMGRLLSEQGEACIPVGRKRIHV